MTVVRESGLVDRGSLDLIREPLKDCEAGDVLDAIATYDAAFALERQLMSDGHGAHQLPRVARQRHHDQVVADLLAGRYPDDVERWTDVIAADHDLEMAKARVAAAQAAVNRAGRGLYDALQTCWSVVVPFLAANRAERGVELETLYRSVRWPELRDPPGIETATTWTAMHFLAWWPLSWPTLDPAYRRRDAAEFNEWGWQQLAAGAYDADETSIAFRERWEPPKFSAVSIEGVEQLRRPVIRITEAAIAAHEEAIAKQR